MMENRINTFGKLLLVILLIVLAQIPIYFMQQYAVSVVNEDYFSNLSAQAIDYTHRVVESLRGSVPATETVSQFDHSHLLINTLNSSFLTLALGFLCLLVIDIVKQVKLSWVNYVIVAIGLVLFYLLELVLASYCTINVAYFIAVAISTLLLVVYLSGALKSAMLSILYGIGLVLIFVLTYYLNLYVDNRLVYLAICVFALFVVIIIMTRKINWNERAEVTKGSAKKLN